MYTYCLGVLLHSSLTSALKAFKPGQKHDRESNGLLLSRPRLHLFRPISQALAMLSEQLLL